MTVTSIVPEAPSASMLAVASSVSTPALLYVAEETTRTVTELHADLAVIPNVQLCYAVKANRFPPLLKHMASLGLGADVASLPELRLATAAGFSPIYATGPGLSLTDMVAIWSCGGAVDLDNLSQLRQLVGKGVAAAEIGLRIRTPVSPADSDGPGLQWSRFGVDPADPELHDLLKAGDLRVTRLHVHTGELSTPRRVASLVDLLLSCRRVFPDVTTLNLGGGLASLYAHRPTARQAWSLVSEALAGRGVKLVVEPGALLTSLAGYLVTSVLAVGRRPDGRRFYTVDASGWNLFAWAPPRIAATLPQRDDGYEVADVAGTTCYEQDYLARGVQMPALEVGDRVIFARAGAYVSSMARVMHGVPAPVELLINGDEVVTCDDEAAVPRGRG